MFGWIKSKLHEVEAELQKFNNTEFLDAIMAGSVIIAAADGEIESAEKAKMLKFVQTNQLLKVFNTSDVAAAFNKYADQYEFDSGIGYDEAIKAVRKVNDAEQKRLLVRVCVAIAKADGEVEAAEVTAVKKICTELGLDAQEFLA